MNRQSLTHRRVDDARTRGREDRSRSRGAESENNDMTSETTPERTWIVGVDCGRGAAPLCRFLRERLARENDVVRLVHVIPGCVERCARFVFMGVCGGVHRGRASW